MWLSDEEWSCSIVASGTVQGRVDHSSVLELLRPPDIDAQGMGGSSKYDVIVDDGMHDPNYQARTIQHMWPLLRPGGRYFVEDIMPESLPDLKQRIAGLALTGLGNMEVAEYKDLCIQAWCPPDTRILYVEKSDDTPADAGAVWRGLPSAGAAVSGGGSVYGSTPAPYDGFGSAGQRPSKFFDGFDVSDEETEPREAGTPPAGKGGAFAELLADLKQPAGGSALAVAPAAGGSAAAGGGAVGGAGPAGGTTSTVQTADSASAATARLQFFAERHETDKQEAAKNYVSFYASHLQDWEENPVQLLEVGIGSLNPLQEGNMLSLKLRSAADEGVGPERGAKMANYQSGASLRMWADWFHHPQTKVDGIDMAPDTAIIGWPEFLRARYAGRVRTLVEDSTADGVENKISAAFGGKKYDVVVDDGMHIPYYQAATLRNLWPILRPGGR